ncbi:hypothetical protein L0244_37120 [bacterium]|nr:hypothetical protein [bacterium]
MRRLLPFLFCLFFCQSILFAIESDILVSSESFSPSLGQRVSVTFRASEPGKITAEILDLSQKVVRTLASEDVKAGFLKYDWDGRDANGAVVKNGCYLPRIRFESTNDPIISPTETLLKEIEIKADYYERLSGVLSYTLPQSSLVTVKAEIVTKNKATGEIKHNVKKVIVENGARTTGKVIEYFDGYGDDGVYLPNGNYTITIAVKPLPPNTIIVYGGSDLRAGTQ